MTNVPINNFNAYNKNTGEFVCPMTGIYAIGCVMDESSWSGRFQIVKNDYTTIARGEIDGTSTYTQNVVIKLYRGDRIKVVYHPDSYFSKLVGDYRTSFHGFFLQ